MIPVLADARAAARRAARCGRARYSFLFGWLRRLLTPGILLLAALIFCYRFGDQLLTTLLVPFLIDRGLGLDGDLAAQRLGGQRDEHRRRAHGRLAGVQHRPSQCLAHQRRRAGGFVHAVRCHRARRRRHRPAVGRDDRRRRPRHDGDGRAVRADDGCIGSGARWHGLHAAGVRRARGRHAWRTLCGATTRRRVRLRDRVHDRRDPRVARLPGTGLGAGPQSDSRRASPSRGARPTTGAAATPSQTSATGY